MTSRGQRQAALRGWVRLLPQQDCYGIPLFKGKGNVDLIPETDEQLSITSFVPFYNEDGYSCSYILPRSHESRLYAIGDKVPIPFQVKGEAHVVDASGSAEDFLRNYASQSTNRAIRGVAGFLRAASNGTNVRRASKRAARIFRLQHDEILSGEPAHSTYWALRFGRAVSSLKDLRTEIRGDAQSLVLKKAAAWLDRFSSKSEKTLLDRVLAYAVIAGGQTDRQILDSVFTAIFRSINQDGQPVKINKRVVSLAQKWFPQGLYSHYVSFGVPSALIQREHSVASNFSGLLLKSIDTEIKELGSFERSLAMATILYGAGDLPSDLERWVEALVRGRRHDLQRKVDSEIRPRSRINPTYGIGNREAKALLAENERVIALYRIANGVFRVDYDPKKQAGLLGLKDAIVSLLQDAAVYTRRGNAGEED